MTLEIRRMQAADVNQVANLETQIFMDAWPRDAFEEALQQKRHTLPLTVWEEDQLAGYAIVVFVVDEVHINNIAVAPQFRRRGIAGQLLQYIFESFPEHRMAFLGVRKSNHAAIRLYRKFGFEVIHQRRNYYSDGEDALVMQRNSTFN